MRTPTLGEAALAVLAACAGGALHFLVTWGSITERVEAQEQAHATHALDEKAHTRQESVDAINEKVDALNGRFERFESEQRSVNSAVVGALGRIEGQMEHINKEND